MNLINLMCENVSDKILADVLLYVMDDTGSKNINSFSFTQLSTSADAQF